MDDCRWLQGILVLSTFFIFRVRYVQSVSCIPLYPYKLFPVAVSPCTVLYPLWLYPPVTHCITCGCIPLYRTVSPVAVSPCSVLYPLWLYPPVPYCILCRCIPLYRIVSPVAVSPYNVLYPLWLYPTVPYCILCGCIPLYRTVFPQFATDALEIVWMSFLIYFKMLDFEKAQQESKCKYYF